MHSLWNEVFPVAPLLEPMGIILGCLVVIALITIVVALIDGIFFILDRVVSPIPVLGSLVGAARDAVRAGFTNRLAAWNHSAQEALGAAFHSLARAMDWLGHELEQHSKLLWTITGLLVGPGTVADIRALINRLLHGQTQQHAINQSQARVNRATHAQAQTATREAHIAHRTAVAIPGQLSREWDIPKLRDQVKDLENGALHTFKWIRTHPLSLATGAFAGAVAVALQRIGASWIRCSNWRNIGRVGCSLEADALSGLLGAFFTVEALANLRTLVKVAQEAEHGVAAGIKDLLEV